MIKISYFYNNVVKETITARSKRTETLHIFKIKLTNGSITVYKQPKPFELGSKVFRIISLYLSLTH